MRPRSSQRTRGRAPRGECQSGDQAGDAKAPPPRLSHAHTRDSSPPRLSHASTHDPSPPRLSRAHTRDSSPPRLSVGRHPVSRGSPSLCVPSVTRPGEAPPLSPTRRGSPVTAVLLGLPGKAAVGARQSLPADDPLPSPVTARVCGRPGWGPCLRAGERVRVRGAHPAGGLGRPDLAPEAWSGDQSHWRGGSRYCVFQRNGGAEAGAEASPPFHHPSSEQRFAPQHRGRLSHPPVSWGGALRAPDPDLAWYLSSLAWAPYFTINLHVRRPISGPTHLNPVARAWSVLRCSGLKYKWGGQSWKKEERRSQRFQRRRGWGGRVPEERRGCDVQTLPAPAAPLQPLSSRLGGCVQSAFAEIHEYLKGSLQIGRDPERIRGTAETFFPQGIHKTADLRACRTRWNLHRLIIRWPLRARAPTARLPTRKQGPLFRKGRRRVTSPPLPHPSPRPPSPRPLALTDAPLSSSPGARRPWASTCERIRRCCEFNYAESPPPQHSRTQQYHSPLNAPARRGRNLCNVCCVTYHSYVGAVSVRR
eukprot:bmy_10714T0